MRRLVLLVALLVVPVAHARKPATVAVAPAVDVLVPELEPLRPLLGDWVSIPTGTPGEPTGAFSLHADLGGHVLLRRNTATTPQGSHADLLLVHVDAGALRAVYVDDEGHRIDYAVTPTEHGAVFASGGDGMRFRLTYTLEPDGTLGVDFAIARPGGDFVTWVAGRARRVGG